MYGSAPRPARRCLQISSEVAIEVIKALAELLENPLKSVLRGLTEFKTTCDGLGEFSAAACRRLIATHHSGL